MSLDSKAAALNGGAGESLAAKRVLVTGARGFLGRAVIDELVKRGRTVEAVVSTRAEPGTLPDAASHPGVTWHRVDLLASESVGALVDKVEATSLIHLAWAPNQGIYDSPDNAAWAQAGSALVDAFLAAGGERIVGAGSSAEYDWSSGICREGVTPLSGNGAYGEAKRALGDSFQRSALRYGASSAWARIFFLYGPHEPDGRLVPAVCRALLTGEPVRCSHGRQVRDYLHVADAAEAMVEILDSDLTGPVNVASGQGVAVRDLVLALARLEEGVERIEWGAIPATSHDHPRVVAAVERLRDELGWSPKFELKEGLESTLAWWRQTLVTEETGG